MEKLENPHPESYLETPKENVSKLGGKSLINEVVRSFKCGEKDCNKTYTSKSHLDRHILSVHIKSEFPVFYSCPECFNTFSNRQNLNRHVKRIHMSPVKAYKCDVCGDYFKKKHLLSTHMYKHTFIKAFSCTLCEKEFASHYERKKHMRYHKTYSCEYCYVVFNHWSKYLKHRRLDHQFSGHLIGEEYRNRKGYFSLNVQGVCDADLKFMNVVARWPGSTHDATIFNNSVLREFICDVCGRKFKKRDHIIRHLKTHTVRITPKIHACPYEDCDRSYTRNSNLKQHIKIKHLEIKHECEICEAKLSTKAKLNKHLQVVHLESKPPTKTKTIVTGRKERKDKGSIKKTCTALRISGLIIPDGESIEKTSEELFTSIVCEPTIELYSSESMEPTVD